MNQIYRLPLRSLFLSVVFSWIAVLGVQAQLTRGYMSGTVTDPSGAVIAGARVTVTNKATNIQQESSTNELGVYRFVAVEPGIYAVAFSSQGFETRKVENIQVGTAQEVVINQALKVGAEATIVEVMETPPGVELAKTTATIDRKLDGRLVVDIPTTGGTRDITRLVLLAPTVTWRATEAARQFQHRNPADQGPEDRLHERSRRQR